MVALVPEIVVEIGAVAGIAAFVGISLVTIILLVLARDVRRLREWAGRAPERAVEAREQTFAAVGEPAAEPTGPIEDDGGTGELPHGDPFEAEAQAARIRAQRQRANGRGERGGVIQRLADSRAAQMALVAVAVVLVAGGTYAVVGAISGEEEPTAQNAQQRGQDQRPDPEAIGDRALDPDQLQVAVLNGTNASGLATAFQDGVASAGYQIGIVGNSQSTYVESRVMFIRGHRPEAVELAREFDIDQVEQMANEVSEVVEGAPLAVVLGDDKIPAG